MTSHQATLREILRVLVAWVKGQFLIWISATALYVTGFALARAPLWLLLALICGFVEPIPHIGAMVGLLCVLVFTFFGSGGDLWVMGASLGVWVIVQLVEGYWIGPKVLGRPLGLSPWAVILGGIAGGLIAGPIGLLVAIPTMAVVAVLVRRFWYKKPI